VQPPPQRLWQQAAHVVEIRNGSDGAGAHTTAVSLDVPGHVRSNRGMTLSRGTNTGSSGSRRPLGIIQPTSVRAHSRMRDLRRRLDPQLVKTIEDRGSLGDRQAIQDKFSANPRKSSLRIRQGVLGRGVAHELERGRSGQTRCRSREQPPPCHGNGCFSPSLTLTAKFDFCVLRSARAHSEMTF